MIDPTISTYLGFLSNILILVFLLTKRINLSADTHTTLIKGIFWILLLVIIFGFINQLLHNNSISKQINLTELSADNQQLKDRIIHLAIEIDSLYEKLERPYQTIGQFSEEENLAVIRKSGQWGFVDKDGFEKFLNKGFQQVTKFNEGLSGVMMSDKKWGFINTRGVFPVGLEPRYDSVNRFEEGEAIVQVGVDRMVIDRKGRVLRRIANRIE